MGVALPYRLIFLRHGETDWNAAGRLQGRMDVDVNARGEDQAAAAGRAVRDFVGGAGALAEYDFLASPLLRAVRTMEIARRAMGLPPKDYTTDERLKEISFGQWEGRTWAEIRLLAPDAFAARKADRWGARPPDGESYALVAERLRPWLAGLAGDAIVVSHGGVARALLHLLAGAPPAVAAAADIPQGRPLILEAGRGRWL